MGNAQFAKGRADLARLREKRGEGGVNLAHHGVSGGPVDAGIGDAHAIAETGLWLGEGLAAPTKVALDHGAHDGAVAGGYLGEELAHDVGLELRFLGGIVMRAIDEDGFWEIR